MNNRNQTPQIKGARIARATASFTHSTIGRLDLDGLDRGNFQFVKEGAECRRENTQEDHSKEGAAHPVEVGFGIVRKGAGQ